MTTNITLPAGYVTLPIVAAMDELEYSSYFHQRNSFQVTAAKIAAWRLYSNVEALEERYQRWLDSMAITV